MKFFYKSKTLIFSYLLIVMGVVEQNYALIRDVLPTEYQGLVFVLIAIIVAVLRVVTTKPLSAK